MRIVSVLILALGLGGCASSLPSARWYSPSQLDQAISNLSKQEELRPLDSKIKRDLGIALTQAGYYERALAKLRTAKELNPKDPLTLYFFARNADETGAYEDALTNYSEYMTLSGRRDGVVLARIQEVSEAKARKELSRAVRQEAYVDAESLRPEIVAVPQYANLAQDNDLDPLCRGLAVVLITDLSRIEALRVVERQKLGILQDEMQLSPAPVAAPTDIWAPLGTTVGIKERLSWLTSPRGFPYFSGTLDDSRDEDFHKAVFAFQEDHVLGADGIPGPRTQRMIASAIDNAATDRPPAEVDGDTAVRMGKLLGAGTIVLGSFTPTTKENIQLQASIAHLTGELLPTTPREGSLTGVLRLQKSLTLDILEALRIPLTDAMRKAIEPLPTENFRAFLSYCRGLDFEARGLPEQAVEAYRQAVGLDPNFVLAQEAVEIAGVQPEHTLEYSRFLLGNVIPPETGILEQLYQTGGWIGMGPGVVLDRGDDDDTEEASTRRIEPARIVIEGELPGEQP